jgi:DNA-binding MarR family transcriptional regulator
MNASAYPAHIQPDALGGPPPVLIAATSEAAGTRASVPAEAAGYRTATVSIDGALPRLDIQISASAFWLEIDEDSGADLDALLDRIKAEVATGRFPAIIAAPHALIDLLATRVSHPWIELVIDGTPIERVEALALAIARSRQDNNGVAEDITPEPSAARLRQLSDEVSRIAATLARLSVGPGAAPDKPEPPIGQAPNVSLDTVRQVIRARRLRARFFDEELFADPAWDMLLDLLQAEIAQHRVPVSSLCIAAAVPATTALRWIKTMTDAGLFKRRADPHDGRRVFVELSHRASDAMRRYFAEVGKVVAN